MATLVSISFNRRTPLIIEWTKSCTKWLLASNDCRLLKSLWNVLKQCCYRRKIQIENSLPGNIENQAGKRIGFSSVMKVFQPQILNLNQCNLNLQK